MRLGVSVGVENWRGTRSIAWPKTDAADFLRVRFTGHTVWQMRDSTRMWRRSTSRESRDRKVEASQKKCTGLHFPQKRDRNSVSTRVDCKSTRQNRFAYSESYDPWISSRSNGIGSAISFGVVSIFTCKLSSSSAFMTAL